MSLCLSYQTQCHILGIGMYLNKFSESLNNNMVGEVILLTYILWVFFFLAQVSLTETSMLIDEKLHLLPIKETKWSKCLCTVL